MCGQRRVRVERGVRSGWMRTHEINYGSEVIETIPGGLVVLQSVVLQDEQVSAELTPSLMQHAATHDLSLEHLHARLLARVLVQFCEQLTRFEFSPSLVQAVGPSESVGVGREQGEGFRIAVESDQELDLGLLSESVLWLQAEDCGKEYRVSLVLHRGLSARLY